ncbi:hypothetical protein YC2023_071524 [Brassica napus]
MVITEWRSYPAGILTPALIPIVPARSPGVRPGFSKGHYGQVSTHLDDPACPATHPKSRRTHNLL